MVAVETRHTYLTFPWLTRNNFTEKGDFETKIDKLSVYKTIWRQPSWRAQKLWLGITIELNGIFTKNETMAKSNIFCKWLCVGVLFWNLLVIIIYPMKGWNIVWTNFNPCIWLSVLFYSVLVMHRYKLKMSIVIRLYICKNR